MIIGARGADLHAVNSGASYLVFGKSIGFTSLVELSALNGATGFQMSGEQDGDRSGKSVAAAGDVNGDGFGDVIIGADCADPHGTHSGASYVLFGRAPDQSVLRAGSRARQMIQGGGFADVLVAAGKGDVLEGRDER